jgi:hypothetical protein
MTPLERVPTSHGAQDCRIRDLACQQSVEILIDDMTEQSFPASDPPAWGTASSRCEQAVSRSQADRERCSVHHI